MVTISSAIGGQASTSAVVVGDLVPKQRVERRLVEAAADHLRHHADVAGRHEPGIVPTDRVLDRRMPGDDDDLPVLQRLQHHAVAAPAARAFRGITTIRLPAIISRNLGGRTSCRG